MPGEQWWIRRTLIASFSIKLGHPLSELRPTRGHIRTAPRARLWQAACGAVIVAHETGRGPWPARPVRGGIHATIEIVQRHPDGDHHGRGVRGIGRDRGSPFFLGRARERPFPGSGWRADPDA